MNNYFLNNLTDTPPIPKPVVNRLNYIGSKFQLLEWINETIKIKTSWTSLEGKTIADLFSGTGIVSYYFRTSKAKVISNDVELYSSIITHALTRSIYSTKCIEVILLIQTEINENKYLLSAGYITINYSPYGENERMFFTIDNAKRIDYIRNRIEQLKSELSDDEYKFIIASLIISADAISNVPAVYGCYLKKFKAKSIKKLILKPVHDIILLPDNESKTFNNDILELLPIINSNIPNLDIVYLDPLYNERQYSKNYFPLNMIALTPEQQLLELPLKGKTGIPESCFMSPFCKKRKLVEDSFEKLFSTLDTKWIFLSYNSESIVSKEKILEIAGKYGEVSFVERDYKRFKSFTYSGTGDIPLIKEYLFIN